MLGTLQVRFSITSVSGNCITLDLGVEELFFLIFVELCVCDIQCCHALFESTRRVLLPSTMIAYDCHLILFYHFISFLSLLIQGDSSEALHEKRLLGLSVSLNQVFQINQDVSNREARNTTQNNRVHKDLFMAKFV